MTVVDSTPSDVFLVQTDSSNPQIQTTKLTLYRLSVDSRLQFIHHHRFSDLTLFLNYTFIFITLRHRIYIIYFGILTYRNDSITYVFGDFKIFTILVPMLSSNHFEQTITKHSNGLLICSLFIFTKINLMKTSYEDQSREDTLRSGPSFFGV